MLVLVDDCSPSLSFYDTRCYRQILPDRSFLPQVSDMDTTYMHSTPQETTCKSSFFFYAVVVKPYPMPLKPLTTYQKAPGFEGPTIHTTLSI